MRVTGMSHEENETEELLNTLLKELELSSLSPELSLLNEFANLLDLSDPILVKIGLDAMALTGVSGDWSFSLKLAERLLQCPDLPEATWALAKVWQLRSLVELDRMAEAIALSQNYNCPKNLLIHVNYLTGLAYEKLDLSEQAKQRFEAVFRENPRFRDIVEKLKTE